MKLRWQRFEDQVRDIASRIYGFACLPGRVAGNDIDGIIELPEGRRVLIEATVNCTLEKVRGDFTKLVNSRSVLFQEGLMSECLIVLDRAPTQAMMDGATAAHLKIMSHNQLASHFFNYDVYKSARLESPFGSAIDPATGNKDPVNYVPVRYRELDRSKEYTPAEIAQRLLSGNDVILLGEYGSGKSRCVNELFGLLANEWGSTLQFPFAINLRNCWGLERADEIVRRHMKSLGLDTLESGAVRAFNRQNIVFLFDGFDEIGTQSWSTDDNRLRQLRATA